LPGAEDQSQNDGLGAVDPDNGTFDMAAAATGLRSWVRTPFGFWASWLVVVVGALVLAAAVRWFVVRRQSELGLPK
jgi:hypothetical protein